MEQFEPIRRTASEHRAMLGRLATDLEIRGLFLSLQALGDRLTPPFSASVGNGGSADCWLVFLLFYSSNRASEVLFYGSCRPIKAAPPPQSSGQRGR